jgi:uncharacterized protein (TIGR03790 family)
VCVLRARVFLLAAALLTLSSPFSAPSHAAVTSENVLVVYNQDSPESVEVANYYAQVHPGVQLLGLTGVTTNEEVTADYYLSTIRPQIVNSGKLTSSISTIVTTKGLPLRINVTESNPGTYVDPFGVARTASWWRPYSSLESELTRIDEVSTWQQMGDQTYFSTTGKPNTPIPVTNPYYGATTAFNYSNYYISGYGGVRLTARLDGFTTTDVKSAIDRAQRAFLLPGSTAQYIVMDDDPNSTGSDRMTNLKSVLDARSYPYLYENTDTATTTAAKPVIGYVSHGTNDGSGGLNSGYIANQLNFTLANGAVFQTHESYNAYSFVSGGNVSGQGLVAEWLAKGGTAGVGNVQEPYSGASYEANEDQMFNMLLNGFTWAEAAWSSIKQLSYVNTVVGDPLMTWKVLIAGDANMDGKVGSADLALLGANWGATGQAGGTMWGLGDFNCDGVVGSADLALLGANWGMISSWASGTTGSEVAAQPFFPYKIDSYSGGTPAPLPAAAKIPEPSTISLAIIGLAAILAFSTKRRGRQKGAGSPEAK